MCYSITWPMVTGISTVAYENLVTKPGVATVLMRGPTRVKCGKKYQWRNWSTCVLGALDEQG